MANWYFPQRGSPSSSWPNRDAIMKEDPDKPKRMRSKSQEGEEEESPASPVTDVSPGSLQSEEMPTSHVSLLFPHICSLCSPP